MTVLLLLILIVLIVIAFQLSGISSGLSQGLSRLTHPSTGMRAELMAELESIRSLLDQIETNTGVQD